MPSLFSSKNSENFFETLYSPFQTMPEFARGIAPAIGLISKDLHISKIVSVVQAPASILRGKIENNEIVLFDNHSPNINTEGISSSFRNGDDGTVTITIYSHDGYKWDEDEIISLKIIIHQLYATGAHITTRRLITQAVSNNLIIQMPNATGFKEFVARTIALGNSSNYDAFYFNIKNFKYVNNVLPFSLETDILYEYGKKLKEFILPNEFVANLGSDNFAALILKERADSFLEYIGNFNLIYEHEGEHYPFTFGATTGGIHMDDIKDPGMIMVYTNSAYIMARQTRCSTTYFDDTTYKNIIKQKSIFAGFKPALENKEFVIYYQPKVNVKDKTICGAEALVRWKSGDKIISPGDFIPVLEKDSSICTLDFYVLDSVCRFINKLKELDIDPIKISTNFSRNHLHNEQLIPQILDILNKYDTPHEFIEMELTESEDFRDYVIMENLVEALRKENISTSIDDFGTGYSSLNMLKKTKLDLIKIDKSFIPLEDDYPEKANDITMFKHIVELAKSLGMDTIAEGVETLTQFEYLQDANCDMVQGYLFDKPLPEDEFIERLRKRQY